MKSFKSFFGLFCGFLRVPSTITLDNSRGTVNGIPAAAQKLPPQITGNFQEGLLGYLQKILKRFFQRFCLRLFHDFLLEIKKKILWIYLKILFVRFLRKFTQSYFFFQEFRQNYSTDISRNLFNYWESSSDALEQFCWNVSWNCTGISPDICGGNPSRSIAGSLSRIPEGLLTAICRSTT